MRRQRFVCGLGICAALALAGCGGGGSFGSVGSLGDSLGGSIGSGPFSGGGRSNDAQSETIDSRKTGQEVELPNGETVVIEQRANRRVLGGGRGSLENRAQVNKHIWGAALDVLSFLPVQQADPFTGVIITGYGTPPGGGRAYRAIIHVTDPALDARALNLSLQTRGGAVSQETVRAVEDAILSRARQLRSGR